MNEMKCNESGLLRLQNSQFFLDVPLSGLKRATALVEAAASLPRGPPVLSSVTTLCSWLLGSRTLENAHFSPV